jgi:hypothetical protein
VDKKAFSTFIIPKIIDVDVSDVDNKFSEE